MHYLNQVEVEGIKLITGFDPPSIDPMATNKQTAEKLATTEAARICQVIKNELNDLFRLRKVVEGGSVQMSKMGTEECLKKRDELNAHFEEIRDLIAQTEQRAAKAAGELQGEYKRLFKDNIVRFVVPGTTTIDDETYELIKARLGALKPGEYLTADLQVVTNRRGLEYVYKRDGRWEVFLVRKLGEAIPEGALLPHELSLIEKEELLHQDHMDGFAAMSREDQIRYKTEQLKLAKQQAVSKRNEFEITGEADPLESARDWLEGELSRIEEMYGTVAND